ncbi:MAG TPA: TRAP transporter small permease [Casimicrobiaceae bacterium]|jgi:TRAP-type C4-dicarboxylate transport system permease small subunit|nr:TRAP transporter small permease [Casimicrobiaceae bacterium]
MKRFESTLANIFGIIFLALSVVVTIETIARKVFTFSLQGADELGGYALAVGSTLAFSLALMGRNHIRVDVFHEFFSRRMQAALNWFSITMIALFALVIALVSIKVLRETVEYGSTAQTPWATPLIYPQSAWYAGFILFMLVAVGYAARATYLLFSGRIDELNVEFHPKSAKEELKEELEDIEHRQAAETAVGAETGTQTGAPK